MPAETLREFVSLQIGFNLLIPRKKNLVAEIERLKAETDSLENVFTEHSLELALLQEKLSTAEQTYQALLTQYRATKSDINNLKLTVNTLRPKVAYQKEERDQLERQTKNLVAKIAEFELERQRLERDIIVYKSTFSKFASLLENARVAKANQPSDVKIVAQAVDAIGLSSKLLVIIAIVGIGGWVGTIILAFALEYIEKARASLADTK